MRIDADPRGLVRDGYEGVAAKFYDLGTAGEDYGAAFCAYVDGQCVLDLWAGSGVGPDALIPVFSSSKAGIGAVMALLLQRGLIELDELVATYWPEFAAADKKDVTVRMLLSHQAGLPAVDGGYTVAELLDHTALAVRLAAQMPLWRPGKAHGYHAVTIGVLADELVRRVTGRTLSDYFATEVRDPLELEFYLGRLGEAASRVIDVIPSSSTDRDSTGAPRIDVLPQDQSLEDLVNDPIVREVGPSAVGGVASARGLARLHAAFVGPVDGIELFTPEATAAMTQLQSIGPDLTLGFLETSWAVVFVKPDDRLAFGGYRAFGHDGYGGALGMADPACRVACGYVTPYVPDDGQADWRSLALTASLREVLSQSR